MKQVLELNWQRVMAELFPDKVNRDVAFEDVAKVFDKNVNRVKNKPQEEPEPGIPGVDEEGPGGAPQPASQVAGGGGSQAEIPSLRDLAQQA